MLRRPIHACLLALLLGTLALAADPPAISLHVSADRPGALYHRGETVTFLVELEQDEASLAGQPLSYRISKDGVGELATGSVTSAEQPVAITTSLDQPGILRCEVTFEPDGGKPVRGVAGAGVDPTDIPPSLPVPDDFDAYWAAQKKLVHDQPMNLKMEPVDSSEEGIVCFDIKADCPGGSPLSGYYAKPADAKPGTLPAILYAHGAGVYSSSAYKAINGAKLGAIALDFNAHGLPNGQPKEFYDNLAKGELKGYPFFGRENREEIYFRGMLLRVIRALQFITSQPEWDGRILVTTGSSQGGGQAIAAAGLDPRVTFVAANVPAMCDHTGFLRDRATGWPRLVPQNDGQPDENILQIARYYDAMNFAARTNAEALFTTGFIDQVTPSTSIYAAYNNLPNEKRIINEPGMGHAFPARLVEAFNEAIAAHIQEMQQAALAMP